MYSKNKVAKVFFFTIIIFSVLLINVSPVSAQFSNLTFSPLMPAFSSNPFMSSFQYGGIMNPFNPFLNSISFNPFGINSLGLVFPFLGLNPLQNSIFTNPLSTIFNPMGSPLSVLDSLSLTSSFLPLFQMPFGGLGLSPTMQNPMNNLSISLTAPISMRVAAQAGTWIGTWQSTSIAFIILFNSGTMNMTLVENPILNTIDGTAILVGSRFANTLYDVRGVLTDPTNFVLEGIVATGIALVLNCTLTSPTTMIGTYTSSFGFGGQVVDTGVFSLTLV